MSRQQATWVRVTPDGDLYLPEEILARHGLENGGDVVIEDTGEAIVLKTMRQVILEAQALSRELLQGKPDASVDDFLADRRRESWDE